MTDSKPVNSHHKTKIIVLNSILAIGIIWAMIWGISTYINLEEDLYTNDAQVEEYINPVNVRIPGYIKEVHFQEYQHIKKGDTLVVIDDREYNIQLELAEAAFLSAQASRNVASYAVNTVHSNINITNSNIKASEARLWNAEQNFHRYESLLKDSAATQQQFDQVKTEYNSLLAQTNALEQQRNTTALSTDETSKKISINDAEIRRAHAVVDMARLNLSYTVITAPYDGVTGRRTIQEGQLIQAGQTLLSFVRNDSLWVVANYKETQVAKLHIGQKMRLTIDGLNKREITGIVVAISQATGSRFSAVPVDNSTGNFIKVQQRIPVKIAIAPDAGLDQLRAGMNVEVRIMD